MTRKIKPKGEFYLHLVSDATGQTLQGLARAAIAQFEGASAIERLSPLVRSERQLGRVLQDIKDHPGPVLYTLVDDDLSEALVRFCASLQVPCVAVMDPIIGMMSNYLQQEPSEIPGRQHKMDDDYFKRIEAVDFALSFDDGQLLTGIETADVVLVGVSRTSKTPTCIYLANSGIRAANVPLVPGVDPPQKLLDLKGPLIVGLTESPDRLIQLRSTRLRVDPSRGAMLSQNAYLDPEKVEHEVDTARKLFANKRWPVIDVTKRSVEETAAEIMVLLQQRNDS